MNGPNLLVVCLFILQAFILGFSKAGAQEIADRSFELPRTDVPAEGFWTVCEGSPDTQVLDRKGSGIHAINTSPSDGSVYLGMVATNQGLSEAVGQPFAMKSGIQYVGAIDLFRSMAHQSWTGTGQIEIWGGESCGHLQELLWASGTISNVDLWARYRIDFTPMANHAWIVLRLAIDQGTGAMTYVCADNLALSSRATDVHDETSISATKQIGSGQLGTVMVFPNPASDRISIAGLDPGDSPVSLQLFALSGQKVLQLNVPVSVLLSLKVPDSIPPGLYNLRLVAGGKSSFQKIQIVR